MIIPINGTFISENLRFAPATMRAKAPTRRRKVGLGLLVLSCLLAAGASAQDLSNPDTPPVTLTGSLVTSAENYSIPGLATNRPVNTARMYFNPTLSIYGIDLPFSIVLSTEERSFNQPFNQFGVSPRYKWLTLHAGYRTLRLSDFSLSDALILGGGLEVDASWFHASAMYGRFRRSVDEDTLAGILPVYKQMGWATKIGFGSQENFFNINMLHAWDDSASLSTVPVRSAVYPRENLVMGFSGMLTFMDGRLALAGEIAGSFMSRDTRLPETDLSGNPLLHLGLFTERLSTRFNLAMKTSVTYRSDVFIGRLEYARVEPEYESMGVLYIQNDKEEVTFAPTAIIAGGKLRAGGSVGLQWDNLYNNLAYTTRRVISSANINWMPSSAFGLDASYSNYSMNNRSAALQVNDSTRVENVTQSFSLSPRYSFITGMMQHFVLLYVTRQEYADRNVLTGALSNNDVLTAMLSYSGTLSTGLGFTASFQYTDMNTAYLTNRITGVTIGGSKPFFDNALYASLQYTLNFTKASTESATDVQNLVTLSLRYKVTNKDALDLYFQFNTYEAASSSRTSYSGTQTRLQYSRSFSFGMK